MLRRLDDAQFPGRSTVPKKILGGASDALRPPVASPERRPRRTVSRMMFT